MQLISNPMEALQKLGETLHYVLVHGALEKGGAWGGPECAAALSGSVHFYESFAWLTLGFAIIVVLRPLKKQRHRNKHILEDLEKTSIGSGQRLFEVLLGSLHVLMFLQIVYYKMQIVSMINMLQPCHVILLLQGIALLADRVTAVNITVLMLPALTGTALAMLFPETKGLDQVWEVEAYWLQHYLIQTVPIYLLIRRNFLALRYADLFSTECGLLILLFLHFSMFEVIDWFLGVNVEFMLCPTGAMNDIFPLLPQWLMLPSYRSTLTYAVILVGNLMSFAYILVAKAIRLLVSPKSSHSHSKHHSH